ncbi:MAG: tRNA (adenosine(37)-N6)-dimethylallyltransferase MiaA [Paludibacter sp.]|nr:tRNA (adenosine(37)-N6)-dimethylallyltransferase MiaA [Bacteroidales bacterium]MCM1069358.1 tRNA (adenosine(37)-N6)-dimethylallyltransferase MiaA [Prevotella sp.]MCM1353878.1 tRNA (adenosine(37)-N6)-dimethylallyltransferase MiaA [Bacteroides sp.]MCM1442872.1 tRNA (adenosine(37)-N6)-dimethylallyltransferase MiaA [Muribaculum sp.]MCM1481917.1 tRNA (adenosine(37)-N6)-dimethylallyltransferase MiaA [Paludibacter sp.]
MSQTANNTKTLLVLSGPTGVGKTALSIDLAEQLGSPIISADSRQIYREIPIGTAAPTAEDQTKVTHYFVGTKSVKEDYNAGNYADDVLRLLEDLFKTHDTLLLTGGSMLYIDAVCKGLDVLPTISSATRAQVQAELEEHGLAWLQAELQRSDPAYYAQVDLHNKQRVVHAVEICREAGVPYSSLRTGQRAKRPFKIVKTGLRRERNELYTRINRRVDEMLAQGLVAEAERMLPFRYLNSLNTVGYKEIFRYFDGEWTLQQAGDMIKQNSRHYAKRQMTWFNRDSEIHWLDAHSATTSDILKLL